MIKLLQYFYRLPGIRTLHPVARFFVFAGIFLLAIIVALYNLLTPTTAERLSEDRWCVVSIKRNGIELQSRTGVEGQVKIVLQGCEEMIEFTNGGAIFPGFDSEAVSAEWETSGDSLRIFYASKFKEIYEGTYKLEIWADQLKLTSSETVITARRFKLNLPF